MNSNRNLKKGMKRSVAMTMAATMLIGACTPQGVIAAQKTAQGRPEVKVTAGASRILLDTASNGLDAADALSRKDADYVEVNEANPATLEEGDTIWENRLFANVENSVNVRRKADETSEIVGKLHKGDLANITGETDGWYEIVSGDVKGFVSAEYALVGEEARIYAEKHCKLVAKVTTDGLRVRKEAKETSEILTILGKKDKLEAVSEQPEEDGWIKVKYAGEDAYVSADFVKVKRDYGKANTLEQEKKEMQEASANQTGTASDAMTADVYWLAAIASHEAATYQGQLAVAAVVMNRVKSNRFPNTVQSVILAQGQFVGATTISRMIRNGLSEQSIRAARAALAGYDPTGGCYYFWAAWTGHSGVNIGGNVFWR
jgi:spore germination cell wall hydrolase CwlJ-like protein